MNSILIKRVKSKIRKTAYYPVSMYKAYMWLRKVIREKSDDDVYVVLLPGIGDTIFALSYFSLLKKNYGNRLVFITAEKNIELVRTYGTNRIIAYSNSKKAILCFNSNLIIASIARKYNVINTNPYLFVERGEHYNALWLLKERVYKLRGDIQNIYFPVIPNKDFLVQPEENYYIINPYSSSIFQNRQTLYEQLVEYLNDEGYKVYTNIVGDQKPIKGSVELKCEIFDFFFLCCHAKGIISLRSGILDYAIHSGIPIFAMYENCSNQFKTLYSLKQWPVRSQIMEMSVDGMRDEFVLSKIIEWVNYIKNKEDS